MNYYIGVDVGTGSARAGIFDSYGNRIAMAKKDITTWAYDEVYKEQSSDEIWRNICEIVKEIVQVSKVPKENIKGIGFDATCSLVALDKDGEPVSLNLLGNKSRNIILWMDHRAGKETKVINEKQNRSLDFVGGKISIEMEVPKILWIKNNLKTSYEKIQYFFDLPDFLVYKATKNITRSMCSLGCKWNYLNHENKWEENFFKEIGLEEISDNNYEKIGGKIEPIGQRAGFLSVDSSDEMGLIPGIPVGVSMIDAHAGGLGVIGIDDGEKISYHKRIALIGGTSSCHMGISKEMTKVPGVWGPYYEAMLPEYWLLEGGQSATGALVDFMIKNHPAYEELCNLSKNTGKTIYEELNSILINRTGIGKLDYLTKDIHILPYFIGNRSPRSNPDLKGAICGLTMDNSLESLAVIYLATIQSIAYGTRHIIQQMNKSGMEIEKIFMTGGGVKNPIFLKSHSNITGMNIVLGEEEESVLLGASILGAVANKEYSDIYEAMKSMSRYGKTIKSESETFDYHEKKYKIFLKMYEDFISYNNIMNN